MKNLLLTIQGANSSREATRLRSFLDGLREELARSYGILFPESGYSRERGHARLLEEGAGKLRRALREELSNSSFQLREVLLSSEVFLPPSPSAKEAFKEILHLLGSVEHRGLVYLERQDHCLVSCYCEFVKKGWDGSGLDFGSFLLEQSFVDLNYFDLLRTFARSFNPREVIVRAIEREQLIGGDLIDDFSDFLGIRDLLARAKKPPVQRPWSRPAIEILRCLNKSLKDGESFEDGLAESLDEELELRAPADSGFYSSEDPRRELLLRCEPQNALLAKAYLKREDGVLFKEPWPEPSKEDSSDGNGTLVLLDAISDQFFLRKTGDSPECSRRSSPPQGFALLSRGRRNFLRLRDGLKKLWITLWKRFSSDCGLIEQSGLFDEQWYLTRHPRVRKNGVDPLYHYLKYGWREGLDPGPRFDTQRYLEKFPELGKQGFCPLLHYLRSKGKGD